MLAILEFWDFFWIFVIVLVFAGGSRAVAYFQPKDEMRLRRLEAKVDLLLRTTALSDADRAELQRINEELQVHRIRPREPAPS
ncbi:MAG TPA: hypothetical protein VKE40_19840 [Gemmataceae bacterium]|nr:hypothetical protein [Gemmataceae bacterium]